MPARWPIRSRTSARSGGTRAEGKLTNPDVDYPDYPEGPAAFACTRNFCSLPVTDAAAIPAQIDRLQRALAR